MTVFELLLNLELRKLGHNKIKLTRPLLFLINKLDQEHTFYSLLQIIKHTLLNSKVSDF